MQPTPVFLGRESPWTKKPGRLQSIGLQRVRHDWIKLAHMHFFKDTLRRKQLDDNLVIIIEADENMETSTGMSFDVPPLPVIYFITAWEIQIVME